MDQIISLFMVESISFIVTSCVIFLLLLILTENEHNFIATIFLIIYGILVHIANPSLTFSSSMIIFGGIIYVVVGIIWSFIKWFSVLNKKASEFKKLKQEWIKYNKYIWDKHLPDKLRSKSQPVTINTNIATVLGKQTAEDFKQYLVNNNYMNTRYSKIVPTPSDYNTKIIGWIIYWPFSMVKNVVQDIVGGLVISVHNKVSKIYIAISNKAFDNTGLKKDV